MTIHQTTAPVVGGGTVAAGLPLYRLNLMRVMLAGINYWDGLKDSPSQTEICSAIFAMVLELYEDGIPMNESTPSAELPPGCTVQVSVAISKSRIRPVGARDE